MDKKIDCDQVINYLQQAYPWLKVNIIGSSECSVSKNNVITINVYKEKNFQKKMT